MFRALLVAVVLLGVPLMLLGQEKPPDNAKPAGGAVQTIQVSEPSVMEVVRVVAEIGLLALIAILLLGLRGDIQRLTELSAKATGTPPPPA